MAEAEDLKSSQCGFDPHSGHTCCAHYWFYNLYNLNFFVPTCQFTLIYVAPG